MMYFSSADEIHAPEDPACALCHITEDERALLVRMAGDYRNTALAAPTMPEEKVCSARGETYDCRDLRNARYVNGVFQKRVLE
jgi:hypothetical protein